MQFIAYLYGHGTTESCKTRSRVRTCLASIYDGKGSQTLSEFVSNLEGYFAKTNPEPSTEITLAVTKLTDDAKMWWFQDSRRITTWAALKKGLRDAFVCDGKLRTDYFKAPTHIPGAIEYGLWRSQIRIRKWIKLENQRTFMHGGKEDVRPRRIAAVIHNTVPPVLPLFSPNDRRCIQSRDPPNIWAQKNSVSRFFWLRCQIKSFYNKMQQSICSRKTFFE